MNVSLIAHEVQQRTQPDATPEADIGRHLTWFQSGRCDRGEYDIVIPTIQTSRHESASGSLRLTQLMRYTGR